MLPVSEKQPGGWLVQDASYLAGTVAQAPCVARVTRSYLVDAVTRGSVSRHFKAYLVRYLGLQASVRQSRELQAEWQHKYMSIQGESAIMKHELDDVRHSSTPVSRQ